MINTAPSGLTDRRYPYKKQWIDCPPTDWVPPLQFAEVLPVQEVKNETGPLDSDFNFRTRYFRVIYGGDFNPISIP
ncbi:hypothetical protein [Oscillatoria acuminata]|uniref:hypothetical protein n=1 Tax=Oscillatoria acuminata TaxID=118323 RepID=UPI0012EA65F8|nr:hypothetical protein [Oscillatoria acuminata]